MRMASNFCLTGLRKGKVVEEQKEKNNIAKAADKEKISPGSIPVRYEKGKVMFVKAKDK